MRGAGLDRHGDRWAFGHAVIGPILAQMLRHLHASLHASPNRPPLVFFCARGGLVLRRTLELFARSVGSDLHLQSENFMVSRVAAFRTAFQRAPTAVAPLIEMEFAGRTCADAARALTNVDTTEDARWQARFSVPRWLALTGSTELGRRITAINDTQANLLRAHIDALRGTHQRIMLCDTGVFGSIVRYLQLGVPEVDWRLTLLFRANYKGLSPSHFTSTVGAVSESNAYVPWRPATVALLYWQFIEAMLEPDLPSVRYYREGSRGQVVSDLEVVDWHDRLDPPPASMLAGACSYLRELTPASLSSIESRGAIAWRRLRRRILFPTTHDVSLLAVGSRTVDFGIDESVEFSGRLDHTPRPLHDRFAAARDSMWPEGEMRKQFPRMAGLFLAGSELSRLIRAVTRFCFPSTAPWNANNHSRAASASRRAER
jgi:hypothetical protein